MAKTYTLEDYTELAYEFAIRNPRVIELLKSTLTEEVAKELLEYGIDTLIEYTDDEGNPYTKYSLEELYLDYPHLGDNLKNVNVSHNGETYEFEKYRELFPDATEGEWKGYKRIVHPNTNRKIKNKESSIDALNRINEMAFDVCMKEGSREGVKRSELMCGDAFNYYDEKYFNQKSTSNISKEYHYTDIKTINKYTKFIKEWIEPNNYLQLIPVVEKNMFKRRNIDTSSSRYY